MSTRMQRQRRKEVRLTKLSWFLLGCAITVIIMMMWCAARTDKANEINEYKMCIMQQHYEHGWIMRSVCSTDYNRLDKEAGLEYKQVGKDIYLVTEK